MSHCTVSLGLYEVSLVTLRSNPVNPKVVARDSTSTPVDPSLDLVVILHGFTGSITSKSVTLIRDALLYVQNVTVVAVQWEHLARGPWYDEAAANIETVAHDLFQFLLAAEDRGIDLNRVHIIGFSLGAHVAGSTGAMLEGRVGRISGLDPARPGFDSRNSSGRLDASDALFVVGVHTGAGFVAMSEPIGHVDFYPNGGSRQPHCQTEDIPLVCNHFMAYTYYAESIYNPAAFPARLCSSWSDFEGGSCDVNDVVPMGYYTPNKTTRGLYFLRTNAQEPYGLGEAHSVDLNVTQSNVLPATPQNNFTESEKDPSTPSANGHHKDLYNTSDHLTNPGDVFVQSLDDLDNNYLSGNSHRININHLNILLTLCTIYLLLM